MLQIRTFAGAIIDPTSVLAYFSDYVIREVVFFYWSMTCKIRSSSPVFSGWRLIEDFFLNWVKSEQKYTFSPLSSGLNFAKNYRHFWCSSAVNLDTFVLENFQIVKSNHQATVGLSVPLINRPLSTEFQNGAHHVWKWWLVSKSEHSTLIRCHSNRFSHRVDRSSALPLGVVFEREHERYFFIGDAKYRLYE